MCTVTYIPKGDGRYMLTSNRDENAARSADTITLQKKGAIEVVFPKDPLAGGTWIVATDDDRLICVLNGAFEKHERTPPYRKSRGIMALEYFELENAPDFFNSYSLDNIEPFTMVIYDRGKLYELRWDGTQKYIKELDINSSYIWSSATLYDAEMRKKREGWFQDWLKDRKDFSSEAIVKLHRNGGEGNIWYDYVMNRNGIVQTVSITNVIKEKETLEMRHIDLLQSREASKIIRLKSEMVGKN